MEKTSLLARNLEIKRKHVKYSQILAKRSLLKKIDQKLSLNVFQVNVNVALGKERKNIAFVEEVFLV